MECCRPNRSDGHLSAEEEAEMEAKTREYFTAITPKRHTKPQRSDYSSHYVDALLHDKPHSIPELAKFQRLEKHPQKIIYNGSAASDEFVETQYYDDLNGVDKQHHTTGTGFIKMEETGEKNGFRIAANGAPGFHGSCQCNPATNDWIPADDHVGSFGSGKPTRSDD